MEIQASRIELAGKLKQVSKSSLALYLLTILISYLKHWLYFVSS